MRKARSDGARAGTSSTFARNCLMQPRQTLARTIRIVETKLRSIFSSVQELGEAPSASGAAHGAHRRPVPADGRDHVDDPARRPDVVRAEHRGPQPRRDRGRGERPLEPVVGLAARATRPRSPCGTTPAGSGKPSPARSAVCRSTTSECAVVLPKSRVGSTRIALGRVCRPARPPGRRRPGCAGRPGRRRARRRRRSRRTGSVRGGQAAGVRARRTPAPISAATRTSSGS